MRDGGGLRGDPKVEHHRASRRLGLVPEQANWHVGEHYSNAAWGPKSWRRREVTCCRMWPFVVVPTATAHGSKQGQGTHPAEGELPIVSLSQDSLRPKLSSPIVLVLLRCSYHYHLCTSLHTKTNSAQKYQHLETTGQYACGNIRSPIGGSIMYGHFLKTSTS